MMPSPCARWALCAALFCLAAACGEGAPRAADPTPNAPRAASGPTRSLGFETTPVLAVPGPTTGIAVADVDGDRRPDLVIVGPSYGVAVLLGKGNGTFREARAVLDGSGKPSAIVAADFDGDGKLDLAATTDAGLDVLFGLGDGSFEPADHLLTGVALAAIAVGDFNGDGRLDVAVAPADGDAPSVLLGASGAKVRAFAPPAIVAGTPGIKQLVAIDVDGDGALDLVAQSSPDAVLMGRGDGTFEAPQTLGVAGRDLAVADVDRDGRPDLLVIPDRWRFLRLLLNTSSPVR
jgi:hypothetical protein